MITSVAGAAEKTSGTAVRTNADEAVKRTDSMLRAPKPASSPAPGSESSVVEISSEGARRAAQQQELQTRARDQSGPQVAPISTQPPKTVAAPVDQAVSAANEQMPAFASLAEESSTSEESAATSSSEAAGSASANSSQATASQARASTVKEFDDADTNQDYTVSVLERRAYDFLHPSLNGSSEQEQTAALDAQKEAQNTRAVDAELKAYTEIAKAGRLA